MPTLPLPPFSDLPDGSGATEPRGAQSERAYALIRRNILRGELAPGAKLRVEALQSALALSSTPVREALNRLTSEGLVLFEENRGFRAAPLLASDLRDVTRMRLLVEVDALADAMSRGDDRWEAEIVGANYRLTQHERKLAETGERRGEQWTDLHKAFHMALISACSYPRILATCSQLFDQSERYRRFAMQVHPIPRDAAKEHEALLAAVLGRHHALAAELTGEHIRSTAEGVSRVLSERPQQPLAAVPVDSPAPKRARSNRKGQV